MIYQIIFSTEALQTTSAKVFFISMLFLIGYKFGKIFDIDNAIYYWLLSTINPWNAQIFHSIHGLDKPNPFHNQTH